LQLKSLGCRGAFFLRRLFSERLLVATLSQLFGGDLPPLAAFLAGVSYCDSQLQLSFNWKSDLT
jgi:hypothetical protein